MKKLLSAFFIFLLTFIFLKFGTQSTFATESKPLGSAINICEPDEVSLERNPRPAICYLCNKDAPLTPSCATSFKVFDEIEYLKWKDEIIKQSWSGNVVLDPTQIKIPFVGKRNMEPETRWERFNPLDTPDENAKRWYQFWEISNASENKYLADYLEGTNEYYRNYGNQTTLTNYQGVLRKLTPYEYQNQLKRQLVNRATEKEIHDYEIKYIGRFCWDVPFWMDAGKLVFEKITQLATDLTTNKILAFFSNLFNFDQTPQIKINLPDIGHYCLYASLGDSGPVGWFVAKTSNFIENVPVLGDVYRNLTKLSQEIPGLIHVHTGKTGEKNLSELANHLPPDPNEEKYKQDPAKYEEDFLKWKYDENGNLSEWYHLWQATPMLSREDTQGEIDLYLPPDPEHPQDSFKPKEPPGEPAIEAVPHLARLYEGSQIIHQILTPTGKEIGIFKSEPITKTIPPNACFIENYFLADESGDGLCCDEKIIKTLTAWEEFENSYYHTCQSLNAKKASGEVLTEEEDDTLTECKKKAYQEVSRAFGINLQHPYLDEIWSYTTYADSAGFFNIFRPYAKAQFEDIAAADTISYSYNPKGLEKTGVISPQEGLFFFPHLGGIQEAKKWVINQALWPLCDKNISSQCP